MDLSAPILDVITGPRGKVLAAVVRQVGRASGREVADGAGVSHVTATRILTELSRTGLVHRQVHGTTHSYRFEHQHVLAPALRLLVQPAEGLARIVADRIRHWPQPPVAAWVLAMGAARPLDADEVVRVVLVQPDDADPTGWAARRAALAERLRQATGNEVELIVETRATLRQQVAERSRLVRDLRATATPVGDRADALLYADPDQRP